MSNQVKFFPVSNETKEIIKDSEILAVYGKMGWEEALLRKDEKLFRLSYREPEDGKRNINVVEGDNHILGSIKFCREYEGYEIKTSVSSENFLNYLEEGKFFTKDLTHPYDRMRRGKSASWEGFFFCNLIDVSPEVEEEIMASVKVKLESEMDAKNRHNFQFGIKDTHRGRLEGNISNKIIEILNKKKMSWLWYSKDAYLQHGSFFLDDHSTQGVFHPDTPIEVAKAASVLNEKEVLVFLLWVLEEKLSISGKTIGLSPANTCPKCGSFMSSGSTRRTIYEDCSSCGYSHREDTGWD